MQQRRRATGNMYASARLGHAAYMPRNSGHAVEAERFASLKQFPRSRLAGISNGPIDKTGKKRTAHVNELAIKCEKLGRCSGSVYIHKYIRQIPTQQQRQVLCVPLGPLVLRYQVMENSTYVLNVRNI